MLLPLDCSLASVQDNVEDVKDIKTSHNRFKKRLFDHCGRCRRCVCTNYNVDPNMKSWNYSKIRFKDLIYFELQQSLN